MSTPAQRDPRPSPTPGLRRDLRITAAATLLAVLLGAPAGRASDFQNGGFESGTLDGWTSQTQYIGVGAFWFDTPEGVAVEESISVHGLQLPAPVGDHVARLNSLDDGGGFRRRLTQTTTLDHGDISQTVCGPYTEVSLRWLVALRNEGPFPDPPGSHPSLSVVVALNGDPVHAFEVDSADAEAQGASWTAFEEPMDHLAWRAGTFEAYVSGVTAGDLITVIITASDCSEVGDHNIVAYVDQVRVEQPAGSFQTQDSWGAWWSGDLGWMVGDFDGDQRDDLLRYRPAPDRTEVLLSDGASFHFDGSWSGYAPGSDGWQVGDFDGDQRDDLLRVREDPYRTEVLLSTGSAFAYAGNWTGYAPGIHGWTVGDFDGDGRDDLLRVREGPYRTEVLLSTGNAFAYAGNWTGYAPGVEGWTVGDFDGDGLDDLLRVREGPYRTEVMRSVGRAFAYAGNWTGYAPGDHGWSVGDFDGDGEDDLLRFRGLPDRTEVLLAGRQAFDYAGVWSESWPGTEGWKVGDYDGDGICDIMRYEQGGAGIVVFTSCARIELVDGVLPQ